MTHVQTHSRRIAKQKPIGKHVGMPYASAPFESPSIALVIGNFWVSMKPSMELEIFHAACDDGSDTVEAIDGIAETPNVSIHVCANRRSADRTQCRRTVVCPLLRNR